MVPPLPDGGPPPEFANALDVLEGEGVALLLAGAVDDAAMQRLVRRMLGDAAEDRYRVLALLDGNEPAGYLPQGVPASRDDVGVLQYRAGRSTAVEAGANGPGRRVDDSRLLEAVIGDLRRACDDLARLASERAARSTPGFEPGELRVAVDSLQPLVESVGAGRVAERLGDDLLPDLRAPRILGRSHWVYYGPAEDPTVETLMADPRVFDVLVRVRRRRRVVEHQWVLRPDRVPDIGTRLESPWMSATP